MINCAGGRKGSAPGLVMERAVQEMSQLRQEIAQFMAQYERGAQHTSPSDTQHPGKGVLKGSCFTGASWSCKCHQQTGGWLSCRTGQGHDEAYRLHACTLSIHVACMHLKNTSGVLHAEHGFKPQLREAERSSPELYDKFVRYVALQDYVRNFEAQLGA